MPDMTWREEDAGAVFTSVPTSDIGPALAKLKDALRARFDHRFMYEGSSVSALHDQLVAASVDRIVDDFAFRLFEYRDFDASDPEAEHELYRHPKIDVPIRDALAAYGVTKALAGECSWNIQHRLHCQGIAMSLHGDPIQ